MEITAQNGGVRLALEDLEVGFLEDVFEKLRQDYLVNPEEVEESLKPVWYSRQGHASVKSSMEEVREWDHALHAFRCENAKRILAWLEALRQDQSPVRLDVKKEEIDSFLVAINDHRLALAARYDLGDSELDHDLEAVEELDRRQALARIILLGAIMEGVLDKLQRE